MDFLGTPVVAWEEMGASSSGNFMLVRRTTFPLESISLTLKSLNLRQGHGNQSITRNLHKKSTFAARIRKNNQEAILRMAKCNEMELELRSSLRKQNIDFIAKYLRVQNCRSVGKAQRKKLPLFEGASESRKICHPKLDTNRLLIGIHVGHLSSCRDFVCGLVGLSFL